MKWVSKIAIAHVIGASAVAGFAAPALAQEDTGADTEQPSARNLDNMIVVTARKQEETLQDIPLPITAFSAEALESRDINDVTNLSDFTPGLDFDSGVNRSFSTITFRGMINNSNFDSTRENASTFVDGVYFIGTPANIDFFDLERVEVVKGPQSAFFGRATFSGAINFITRDPSMEFQGRAFGRIATDETYELAGSLEGPVIPDVLAARVSGRYFNFGGQYRNALTGDQLGEQETASVSGALLFTPTPTITAKFRASYTDQQDGPPASQLIGRLPEHNCGPFGGTNNGSPFGATLFCGVLKFDDQQPALNPLSTNVDRTDPAIVVTPNGFERTFLNLSADVEFDLGGGYTITSVTGYQDEDQDITRDFDATFQDVYQSALQRRSDALSQELRLASPQDDKFSWLVGLYYIEQDYFSDGVFIVGDENPVGFFFGGAGAIVPQPDDTKTIENKAVFGAASYEFNDSLTLSLEGRYQEETVVNTSGGAEFEFKTTKFLPRVILDFHPTDDLTVYASYAKGNKPTQGNAAVLELSPERRQQAEGEGLFLVAPEEIIENYEFGIKTQFDGGRGFANFSAFYAEWEGKQAVGGVDIDFNNDGVIDPGANGNDRERFNGVVLQGGDVKVYGFEIETGYSITPEVRVGANLAYNKNDLQPGYFSVLYERYYGSPDAGRQEEGQAPNLSGSAFIAGDTALSDSVNGFARIDALYEQSYWASILNTAETGDSIQVNFRAGIELNDALTITAYVDNLFNDDTVERLSSQGDSALDAARFQVRAYEAGLPRKRQVGLTVAAQF